MAVIEKNGKNISLSREANRVVALLLADGIPFDLCFVVLVHAERLIKAMEAVAVKDTINLLSDSRHGHSC